MIVSQTTGIGIPVDYDKIGRESLSTLLVGATGRVGLLLKSYRFN